jgi:hypothetical protein
MPGTNEAGSDPNFPAYVLPQVNGASISTSNPLPTSLPVIGVGTLTVIPTSGTTSSPVAIGTPPAGAVGIEIHLNATAATITGTFAANSGAAATLATATPSLVTTYNATQDGAKPQINIGGGNNFFLTASPGSTPVFFRWI